MEKLLKINDICKLLQVKKPLVYKWVHYGFVPYIKIGGILRFKESHIEKWVQKREKRGRARYKVEEHRTSL